MKIRIKRRQCWMVLSLFLAIILGLWTMDLGNRAVEDLDAEYRQCIEERAAHHRFEQMFMFSKWLIHENQKIEREMQAELDRYRKPF